MSPLLEQLIDALRANGIFYTPIALRKNGREWDEFQIDAINRTRNALEKAEAAIDVSDALIDEIVSALRSNGIFHTPLALQKNGQEWNEYQLDAINRTRDCLAKFGCVS